VCQRLDGRGCVVALEEKDDLAVANEDVVLQKPELLEVERRPLVDEASSGLGPAGFDGDNHGNAGTGVLLGPEPSQELGNLAQETDPAQGGDQHTLAGVPL
jgi:hypothetical protein